MICSTVLQHGAQADRAAGPAALAGQRCCQQPYGRHLPVRTPACQPEELNSRSRLLSVQYAYDER